jgi:hypothetical protein
MYANYKITFFKNHYFVKLDKEFISFEMALVHKSKSRRNPLDGSEKLDHFVTLGHTQVHHFIESGTTNQSLSCLCFKQARREFVAKDSFQAKHGCFRQRTDMIARILLPFLTPIFTDGT